jgi:hypothetical protein
VEKQLRSKCCIIITVYIGMRPMNGSNPGRTYRFYTGTPVYPFGTGLSYTTFDYSVMANVDMVTISDLQEQLQGQSYLTAPTVANITVVVANTGIFTVVFFFGIVNLYYFIGIVTSDTVVLAFVIGPNPGQNGNPIKTLVGFTRLFGVTPGQKIQVVFPITAFDLSYVDQDGWRLPQEGVWSFEVEGENCLLHVIQ